MLKKFKSTDIDVLMGIWKKAYTDSNSKIDNKELTRIYTETRDIILDQSSDTVLYTEDGAIEGFITIDKNSQIVIIYVDKKIRREGIGTMLIEFCQKSYDHLSISFADNEAYESFFKKNNFAKTNQDNEGKCTYMWNNKHVEPVNLVYFDDDLNEECICNPKINSVRIDIREILKEDKELSFVKNYMKVRKLIENAFSKKTILYINYGNYYEILDDIIKEIIKIEKSNFVLVVSEPLVIENSKMAGYFEQIEQSYANYKICKIDMAQKLEEDISVNKVSDEKMRIIIEQIDKIAENM